MIVMMVGLVSLHTITTEIPEIANLRQLGGKVIWSEVDRHGRSGHQKHRYFFLGLRNKESFNKILFFVAIVNRGPKCPESLTCTICTSLVQWKVMI